MRVASFEVRGERSVAFARCDQVPPLMIIAGPNGSGKSTVLNSIRKQGGYTNIMYEGPHRSMLRQTVQQRHLLSGRLSLEDLLARPDIQNYDGVQTLGGTRDPWSYDSSSNYFKHALCQIEVERQQAIASRFDRDGEIRKDAIRDAWKPLRELATNLLPHLTFHGIDASNPMGVRCLFRVHGAETLVDLDDLSSGEKSILQMFYPIVE